MLSLNAQVTKARHEAAGITQYVWRTSGDGDVRPDHKALDGQTFSYDAPPVVNATAVRRGRAERREHPGQDYQCRCTAEPVIPGFDDVPTKTDRRDAGDFKESEHPRAKDGQFTSGAAGTPAQVKPPKPPAGPPKGQPTTPSKSAPKAAPGQHSQQQTTAPPHPTTARAAELQNDLAQQAKLHPTAAKKMAVAVTEPDVPGAPRIVTVSNMRVHEAIRTGKIKLALGEELGYPPDRYEGKLKEESHVEVLGARWALDKYNADGGVIGTVPTQCRNCKKLMAGNPRWIHTNPNTEEDDKAG